MATKSSRFNIMVNGSDDKSGDDLTAEQMHILATALAERDHLLQRHPELKSIQAEVERELDEAGPDHRLRLAIIFKHITELLKFELEPELLDLKRKIDAQLEQASHHPVKRRKAT